MKKELKNRYNTACNELAKVFNDNYGTQAYWIGDEIGGILTDDNFYVSMEEIITLLEYDLPISIVLAWQDYVYELMEKEGKVYHTDTLYEFAERKGLIKLKK